MKNRKLREDTRDLQVKCDYYETTKIDMKELEKKLKENYTDDIEQ